LGARPDAEVGKDGVVAFFLQLWQFTEIDEMLTAHDDDALELFKKTLPASSLLQLKTNGRAMKEKALVALQQASKGVKRDFRIDLISLAIKGKKVSFAKVLTMIDDMIALLGEEQTDDDQKKEYTALLVFSMVWGVQAPGGWWVGRVVVPQALASLWGS
jgi:hypothetical protein